MNITVLAAGAWGTALAIAFAGRHRVTLWTRDAAQAADLHAQRENTQYLPGFRLPDDLAVTTDLAAAVKGADLLVVATPISGLRSTAEAIRDLGVAVPFLWVCKGFEAGSGHLPHQVLREVLGEGQGTYGALSGPSFAQEVAGGLPTALALAANNPTFARTMARELHTGRLRVYATTTWPASRWAAPSRMSWP